MDQLRDLRYVQTCEALKYRDKLQNFGYQEILWEVLQQFGDQEFRPQQTPDVRFPRNILMILRFSRNRIIAYNSCRN